jgi:hypothetical protein
MLDRLAGRLPGLQALLLRPEAVIRRAGGPALLAPHDAEAPLRLLLEEYRRHAGLTLVGTIAARFDTLRLLRNLAGLAAREAREPAIRGEPVERPIFITGMPRSGTTFLHKLLAEDPENRFPAVWETVFPLPRGRDDPPARRITAVGRQLAAFERMAPGFRAVHPIDADSPQECSEISAHVFRSYRFETMHAVPGYRAWLRGADHGPGYRFHRRFLQHLQHSDGRPRRWVLKCPDHVFTLGALATEYPDARVVFLHRNPLEVLASVAGLTAILRRPFAARIDPAAIGRQVLEDWIAGAEAMVQAETERLFPAEQVLHLRFADLTAAPMATIELLYRRFGLPLGTEARARMERRVAELPRGGYGGVTHALADYGVDAAATRPRFAAYAEQFGLRI